MSEYIELETACKIYGLSRNHLLRLIADGTLRAIQEGNLISIEKKSLDELKSVPTAGREQTKLVSITAEQATKLSEMGYTVQEFINSCLRRLDALEKLKGARVDGLTISQAAKAVGVSISTVRRWIDRGILKAYKTRGGHRRVDPEFLEDFLKNQDKVLITVSPEEKEFLNRHRINPNEFFKRCLASRMRWEKQGGVITTPSGQKIFVRGKWRYSHLETMSG